MKNHSKYEIEWVGFPKTHRKVRGVYMIGPSIYLGASSHIRCRVLQHIHNSCRRQHINSSVQEYILIQIEKALPVLVTLLSTDPFMEFEMRKSIGLPINPRERYYHENFSRFKTLS